MRFCQTIFDKVPNNVVTDDICNTTKNSVMCSVFALDVIIIDIVNVYHTVVVLKPFLSLCFAFIFVRAILCFKLKVLVRGGGVGGRVQVKNYQMQLLFLAVAVPPAITPKHDPMNRLL